MALKTSTKAGAGSLAVITACAFIIPWEGLWTTAKIDTIGTGNPPTVCYGETEGVKVGDRYTKQECEAMLAKKLPRYAAEIARCIKVPISDKTRAAFISFSYNVGSAGFCRSSAARRLNAGDLRGACDALMQWNRAQGRVVKGLTNRRAAERKLCLEGINEPVVKPIEKTAEKPTFWQRVTLFFKTVWKAKD
jgi:lysozyme